MLFLERGAWAAKVEVDIEHWGHLGHENAWAGALQPVSAGRELCSLRNLLHEVKRVRNNLEMSEMRLLQQAHENRTCWKAVWLFVSYHPTVLYGWRSILLDWYHKKEAIFQEHKRNHSIPNWQHYLLHVDGFIEEEIWALMVMSKVQWWSIKIFIIIIVVVIKSLQLTH